MMLLSIRNDKDWQTPLEWTDLKAVSWGSNNAESWGSNIAIRSAQLNKKPTAFFAPPLKPL